MVNSTLNIYYQNTRGLRTKTHIFKRNIHLNYYDVVAITETWLPNSIHNSELFDDRYLVWRRDRNYLVTRQSQGGGVLLAVRRDISAVEQPAWCCSAEDIWVSLFIKNKDRSIRKIHLCVVYLIKENEGNSFNDQLVNFTNNLSQIVDANPHDTFIIMGDFNFTYIDWFLERNSLQPTGISGNAQISFFDVLSECNLRQFNSCRNVINNRILDYVLCSSDISVCPSDSSLVPEDAHHKALDINLDLYVEPLQPKPRSKYMYHAADFNGINLALKELNWNSLFSNKTLEEAVKSFYDELYELRDKFIPKKNTYMTSYPHWYNTPLKKLLKEKFKFLTRYKKYKNKADKNSFTLLRKRAKDLEELCYKQYMESVQKSIIKNPKMFWSFVKSRYGGSNTLPSTLTYESQSADTGDGIANLFSRYFHTNFLNVNHPANSISNVDRTLDSNNSTSIGYITIDQKEVFNLLSTLDRNKGAGPDDIVPLFIIKCAEYLSLPLSLLYHRSITEGIMPKIWKSAYISPIHKSGDRNNVMNYRPISKLCVFAKVLERLVYSKVYSALSPIFIKEQHGFLKKRSTTTNLLLFGEFVSKNMDDGEQVDAVFTDYSKAFDRIDHSILLEKLSYAGIHGSLFRWFSSYIKNRSQAVVVSGFTSAWSNVPSGVPQGSLLGPLLFVLFINDIDSCFLSSQFILYADDMKIYKQIKSVEDCLALQQDLHRFERFCLANKLDLNVSKCISISFTRKINKINFTYALKDRDLTVVSEIRDLGVTQDSKLVYDTHIDTIVKKAYKSLGFIKRTCSQFSSIKLIKILYCSLVRSILEYSSQVWNPRYQTYIDRIEMIQRKFLKYLQYKCKCNDANYEARCVRQHMLPLHVRRRIADLTFLCKIGQNEVDSPQLLSCINIRVQRALRHYRFLAAPTCATNYRQNSYFLRVVTSFNELTDFPDLDLFNTKPHILQNVLTKSWFDGHSL